MADPLCTIIVNNYNYARFLADAINSALAQTYPYVEIIVVDDGSTDGSPSVISNYGSRITSILKDNGGQASAFNAGFAKSRGSVIVFLDADDVLMPTAVERAVERLRDSGVSKVHWYLSEIDAAGNPRQRRQPADKLAAGDYFERAVREGPLAALSAPTSGNAWSRAFLTRVMPIPEHEFRINTDAYIATLAPLYGRIEAVEEPLGLYRVHSENSFASLSDNCKYARKSEMYVRRCAALARHLRAMEVPFDEASWEFNSPWKWEQRLIAAKRLVQDVVPAGARFILVDDQAWNTGAVEPAPDGRSALPFLNRNGKFAGRPTDSLEAIANLEESIADGAEFIVFTWDTRWWLTEFEAFADHLNVNYNCLSAGDLITVFDLRPKNSRRHA